MIARLGLSMIIASVLVLAAGAGTAAAHKRIYVTEVQLKAKEASATSLELSGKVTSERSRCISGRTVTITANGVEIATATTQINGDYLVLSSQRPAKGTTLIATIARKFLKRSKKHKHKCSSDFSERRAP